MSNAGPFTNSPLVSFTQISPHRGRIRPRVVNRITIHKTGGDNDVYGLGHWFSLPGTRASYNYGVCRGRVGMYVEESEGSWSSANDENDGQSVNIGVSNNTGAPNWGVRSEDIEMLINLCTDICRRNNIPRLFFNGTTNATLTIHDMFVTAGCPGPFLRSQLDHICNTVNSRLGQGSGGGGDGTGNTGPFTNSPLVSFTQISPHSGRIRPRAVNRITIHKTGGDNDVYGLGHWFSLPGTRASYNYGVCRGRVGMYVEESRGSWSSANDENDGQSVNIGVSNNGGAPNWSVRNEDIALLIDLCTDICRRNNIGRLFFNGTTNATLTIHDMFVTAGCPGPFLRSQIDHICNTVNSRLGSSGGGTVNSVSVSPNPLLLNRVGDTGTLRATVSPSTANQEVRWASCCTNVATVNPTSGIVTARGPGTARIRATSSSNSSRWAESRVTVGRNAIIIVPGIMGTELELVSTGERLWPPMDGQNAGPDALRRLNLLRLDSNGNSLNGVRVRANRFGAENAYRTLFNYLERNENFGSTHDIRFYGYDWRMSNEDSANGLRTLVNQYDRVTIVAHSMGGLVVSHMLKNVTVRSRIDKVITLGTPFLGSQDILPVILHGIHELLDEALQGIARIWRVLFADAITREAVRLVARNMPSAYELLPNRRFFTLGNRYYFGDRRPPFFTTNFAASLETTRDRLRSISGFNRELFDRAIQQNDSLWNGNTHVTSHVDSYYIIGEGQSTAHQYILTHSVNITNPTATVRINSRMAGDDSVLSYSASMNRIRSSQCFFVTENHFDLVTRNRDSVMILDFIRNLISGSTVITDGIRRNPNITPM